MLRLKGKERLVEVVPVTLRSGPLVPHGTRTDGHHNKTHRLLGCAAAPGRCCNTDTSSEPKTSTPILGFEWRDYHAANYLRMARKFSYSGLRCRSFTRGTCACGGLQRTR